MPTYEYQCQKCHKHFEEFQRITDPAIKTCPFCKGRVVRLISGGAGLIFKGSGFYITDYKNSPAAGGGKAAKSADQTEPATAEKAAAKKTGGREAAKAPEKTEKKGKKETKEG